MPGNVKEIKFLDARAQMGDLQNPEMLAMEEIAMRGADLVCQRLNARAFTIRGHV